jgi:hypothetical protein
MVSSTSGPRSLGAGNLSVLPVSQPSDEFRYALARGLAGLDPDQTLDLDWRENITLKLSLSLWIRLAGADLAATRWELLALRADLLQVSGLDHRTEPVPLTAREDDRAVLILSVYLLGLIDRAARSTGRGRGEVVEAALARS